MISELVDRAINTQEQIEMARDRHTFNLDLIRDGRDLFDYLIGRALME